MEQLPQNPTELLGLMASTSTQIDSFSDGVIESVKRGEVNPLNVVVQLKAMEIASERIRKEIKTELMTEVGKYPEKDFEYLGNKISKAEHGTKYEFGLCNDPEWMDLRITILETEKKIKVRETFLKALTKPIQILDDSTGELVIVSPPTKTSVSGINISIR